MQDRGLTALTPTELLRHNTVAGMALLVENAFDSAGHAAAQRWMRDKLVRLNQLRHTLVTQCPL